MTNVKRSQGSARTAIIADFFALVALTFSVGVTISLVMAGIVLLLAGSARAVEVFPDGYAQAVSSAAVAHGGLRIDTGAPRKGAS